MTAGEWAPRYGQSIADKHIVVVGHGRIGKAIEARLQGFEVGRVTRVARTAREGVHAFTELDDLLPEADVVVLICPLTDETEHLMDARRLALMPDDALLVNVARGRVVDADALVAELQSGRLRAAADVVDPEPLPEGHPLWACRNFLLSPHTGGWASSFWPRADRLIARQLRHWAAGEPLENRIR